MIQPDFFFGPCLKINTLTCDFVVLVFCQCHKATMLWDMWSFTYLKRKYCTVIFIELACLFYKISTSDINCRIESYRSYTVSNRIGL